MQKLKNDQVTKFALENENYDVFLKKEPNNFELTALATLAKHKAITDEVIRIRNQIPDWKNELPKLLSSCFTKNNGKKNSKRLFNSVSKTKVTDKNVRVPNSKSTKQDNKSSSNNSKNNYQGNWKKKFEKKFKNAEKDNNSNDVINKSDEKIDDFFFIQKKVFVPKLLTENNESKQRNESERHTLPNCKPKNKSFHKIQKNVKNTVKLEKKNTESENLHPSWAAKRVQLIKPFEGKKIKFSDD